MLEGYVSSTAVMSARSYSVVKRGGERQAVKEHFCRLYASCAHSHTNIVE